MADANTGLPGVEGASGPDARSLTLRRWGLAIAALIAVFALSSIPLGKPLKIHHLDKVFHLVEYLALGLALLNLMTRGFRRVHVPVLMAAMMVLLGVGVLDEAYQFWIPGRTPDRWDIVYSGMGGGLSVMAAVVIHRLRPWPAGEEA